MEVVAIAASAIVTWRLTLGWDWSGVPTSDPFRHTAPQSTVDWIVFAIVVMVGVGWLGIRGRSVAGTVAICAPIIVLSGWRMAVSGVLEWPIGLASFVFSLSVICIIAGALGAGLRHVRAVRRTAWTEPDEPAVPQSDAAQLSAPQHSAARLGVQEPTTWELEATESADLASSVAEAAIPEPTVAQQ